MTSTEPKKWEKEFDERFGCKPVSLVELGAAEERGTPLLYPIQGDAVKKFISETIASRDESLIAGLEGMKKEMRDTGLQGDNMVDTLNYQYNRALEDIAALIRSSREENI